VLADLSQTRGWRRLLTLADLAQTRSNNFSGFEPNSW
jgi:hypothetical protein